MTKHLWLAGSVLLSVGLQAQVGINAGQKTDAPQYQEIAKDAVLQVANKQGQHKGVLFPQMTTDERNNISNPTEGLMIYNTTLHCLEVYNNTDWICVQGFGKKGFSYNGRWFNGDKYVKDQKFGDGEHDFIYKVITGPDGKKWLNNNLGADYANVHSSVFNPDQQAKTRDDYHAYGSLFQWQRAADGHELITWTGADSGTPVNGSTSSIASSYENAGTSLFIFGAFSWTSATSPVDLWKKDTSNNPCPVGYHVPTSADWVAYHKAVTGADGTLENNQFWNGVDLDVLKLSVSPHRSERNGVLLYGSSGYYWSSTNEDADSGYSSIFVFDSGYSDPNSISFQAGGNSVRCLKD